MEFLSVVQLHITTHASTASLVFVFFRANIDEVETEVVEIEAKLDKVRHLISSLLMHSICQSSVAVFSSLWAETFSLHPNH